LAREKHSDSMLLGSGAPALPTGNEVLRRNRVSPARQNHNLRHNSGRSGEAHACRRRRTPPRVLQLVFCLIRPLRSHAGGELFCLQEAEIPSREPRTSRARLLDTSIGQTISSHCLNLKRA